MITTTRPSVRVVQQLYFVPSKCVWESFLCDYSLFRIKLWCINEINPSNNIGSWFDYANKIIRTWSQKCFIKYLRILLRRTRMYSYFMKFILCFYAFICKYGQCQILCTRNKQTKMVWKLKSPKNLLKSSLARYCKFFLNLAMQGKFQEASRALKCQYTKKG